MKRTNVVKEKLANGEITFGQLILDLFTPGAVHIIANCGLDFVIFDMEHGRGDIAMLSSLIESAKNAGIVPLARVPDLGFAPLSRMLDLGARGVMVPRVETGDQMRSIVQQLKYAPAGCRGVALGVAHDDYRSTGPTYFAQANLDTIVIALLETVQAFENLDDILSVPGLDIAWMGHYDLTVSMGIPAQFSHPDFLKMMDKLLDGCRRHKVAPGFLTADPASTTHWIEQGFRVISLGTDIGVYHGALQAFYDGVKTSSNKLQSP